jgi:hypothetical protein
VYVYPRLYGFDFPKNATPSQSHSLRLDVSFAAMFYVLECFDLHSNFSGSLKHTLLIFKKIGLQRIRIRPTFFRINGIRELITDVNLEEIF